MRSLSVVILTFAAAAMALAQNGTISGTVSDPLGKAMANAPVQLKNAAGTTFKTASSADGKYSIGGLPAGSYDVSVTIPGLRPFEQKNVTVDAGKALNLNIRIQEGTQLSTLGEDPLAIAADLRKHAPPSGPTPRTADGKPDLTGVWWSARTTDPGNPEWKPWAAEKAKERTENNRRESPQAHCLPSAVLRSTYPLTEFVQTATNLVIINDDDSPGFHQVYLNRAEHPKVPDTDLWYGDSIGHWEGDTLVVDRVNFNDQVWLDADGHPHTDQLHVVERYRRPDLGHLETEVTVTDPETLTKPWTMKRVADLAPKEEIREFMCAENNRDVPHLIGK